VSDFNIQVKVRNARLLRAIRAKAETAAEFSRLAGIEQNALSGLLTMRLSPMRKSGEWTTAAMRICEFVGCMPEEIWPKHMERFLLKKAETEIELSAAEVEAIAEGSENQIQQRAMLERWIAKSGIAQRDIVLLQMRTDGATYEDCAKEFSVSRERVRQREVRAMRKIRTVANRDGIKTFLDTTA
jgi:lambda repressor-like predicted transcriptional regulator